MSGPVAAVRRRMCAGGSAAAASGVVATVMALALGACAGPGAEVQEVSQGTVIQHVTVVDPRDGSLRRDMAVAFDGGRITHVAPNRLVRPTASAQSVDASGQFVIPGLLDMHTHALPMGARAPGPWPMLVAHGITGIREMAGAPALIQAARQHNARVASGELDAPEILAIAGEPMVGVRTGAQATELMGKARAAGADFAKLLAGSREGTLAVLAESQRLGLPVAGHLPPSVTAVQAAQAGWHSAEHLGAGLGILLDCSKDETAIRQALLAMPPQPLTPTMLVNPAAFRPADVPLYQQVLDTYDDARCTEVAAALGRTAMWQVPTLIRLRTMQRGNDPAYRDSPQLDYVDKATRALWRQVGQRFADLPFGSARVLAAYYERELRLTRLLVRHGARVLAGSDLGGGWLVPGYSLHQELDELAAAGLTPLQVLQSATLNPAVFLGREATMGTVAPGRNADLVLLEANPLDDVRHLHRIAGVVLKGRHFTKASLEQMKADVAAAWERQPMASIDSVLDRSHRH